MFTNQPILSKSLQTNKQNCEICYNLKVIYDLTGVSLYLKGIKLSGLVAIKPQVPICDMYGVTLFTLRMISFKDIDRTENDKAWLCVNCVILNKEYERFNDNEFVYNAYEIEKFKTKLFKERLLDCEYEFIKTMTYKERHISKLKIYL